MIQTRILSLCWAAAALPWLHAAEPPGPELAPLARQVTIRRDSFNVPHIFGQSDAACAYAMAWAQCEDHFELTAINLLAAQGRLAEWQGAPALTHDRFVRRHRVPQVVEEKYSLIPEGIRQICDGYAAGFNAYVRQHPSELGRTLGRLGGEQVAALARMIVLVDFILNQGHYEDEFAPAAEPRGSNMWVLGPGRTADGQAMLLINPHLSWAGRHYWYEAHLRSDQGYEMAGAGFFGLPLPVIGHGRNVAWSHTVNNIDLVDIWEERVEGDPPRLVALNGGQRPVRRLEIGLRYRQGDQLIATNYTEWRTERGPLLPTRQGKWFSVRSSVDGQPDFLSPWYQMALADDIADLRRRLAVHRPATFNIAAADIHGNIYYVYNGVPPGRSQPFPENGILPGWLSEHDPAGLVPFAELPQLLNPRCGYVQNCNSTPYQTTARDNPEKKAGQELFVRAGMTMRAHSALRLLESLRGCSWEEFQQAAFDSRCETAARTLPSLIEHLDGLGTDPKDAEAWRALNLWREWDYRATPDSAAMTLYYLWWQRYSRKNPWFKVPFKLDPLATPTGLADPERAGRDYLDAVSELRDRFGKTVVPWGDVQILRRGGRAFPLGGGLDSMGCLRVIGSRWEGNQLVATGGDSYVMAVHLTSPIRAVSIHPLGNSNDPAHPTYTRQTELFCRDTFKPAWFSEEEVRSHTERVYLPGQE